MGTVTSEGSTEPPVRAGLFNQGSWPRLATAGLTYVEAGRL